MLTERLAADRSGLDTIHIGILPLPNFTLLAFAAFLDTLRLSEDEGDGSSHTSIRWTVVAPTMRSVRASCGAELSPWSTLGSPAQFDYIAVVGGRLDRGPLAEDATLAWLRAAADAGITLIGLCAGTFALLRAGVMGGRRCCISAHHFHYFEKEFPELTAVTDRWFVVDRGRITCPGGVAAADVAAHLIKRHRGEDRARKGLRLAFISEPKSPNHPQPLATPSTPLSDTRLQRAVALIEQQIWQAPKMEQLSDRACLSGRQLQRLFRQEFNCSPTDYSRHVRLHHSRSLLKRTDRSVSDIAFSCGFRAAPHFCRQFQKLFKITPLQARAADRISEEAESLAVSDARKSRA